MYNKQAVQKQYAVWVQIRKSMALPDSNSAFFTYKSQEIHKTSRRTHNFCKFIKLIFFYILNSPPPPQKIRQRNQKKRSPYI